MYFEMLKYVLTSFFFLNIRFDFLLLDLVLDHLKRIWHSAIVSGNIRGFLAHRIDFANHVCFVATWYDVCLPGLSLNKIK